MPIFANLTQHERAVLASAADQVERACERPWIAERRREWTVTLVKTLRSA